MNSVITGGSRGIGSAMVRHFAKENEKTGGRLVFSYHRHEEDAHLLSRETGAIALPLDMADAGSIAAFAAEAQRQLGHVDALVLNAGECLRQLFNEQTDEQLTQQLTVNLLGPMRLLQRFSPDMISRRQGAVLMMGSLFGERGAAMEAVYAAVKAGLTGLAKSLAKEWGPSGLRVNALCPGAVDTDMLGAYDLCERDDIACRAALGRIASPDEIAKAAYFLCSEAASFITGQAIVADGGTLD